MPTTPLPGRPLRPLVTDAVLEQALTFIAEYRLEHVGRIDGLLRALAAVREPRAYHRLCQLLLDALVPFQAWHEAAPFVVAPPTVLTGPIVLGRQTADDRPIGLTTEDVNLHGTIVGPSGSGKTTILLTLARGLLQLGVLLGVIDVKEDFGWLLREKNVLLIDEHTRWNFLQTPPFLTAAEHRADVIDLLLTRLYGGELQRQLLDAGWQRAAAQHEYFSLHDLAEAIAAGGSKETPSHTEARRSCVARLRRFAHYALFTTRDDGIPWEILLTRTFVVRTTGFDDLARFQFDLLSRYCFLSNRAARTSGLHRVLLIDESYELLSEAQDGIRSIETLPRLKQLAREFGIAVLTTTVTLRGMSELAQASTHFYLALPPNNHEDARALIRAIGLTAEQTDIFLHALQRGEALLRIGSWPEVIHLQIPPNTERKHATPEDITATRARTDQLARTVSTTSPSASACSKTTAREENEATGWTPPTQAPTTTASREQPTRGAGTAPASVIASVAQVISRKLSHNASQETSPVGQEEISPNALHRATEGPVASNAAKQIAPLNMPRRVALNKHAAAILADVGENPLTLTTPCFGRCNLRLSEGERAKTTVTNLGFLESFKVRTGAGRGKTGSAMRLTPSGWAWLDRKPPKGTRGGDSVQHEFLVRHLARLIAHSTIETLGADLVIPYNAEEHQHLHHALETLSATTIARNTGDLIALEVECSRPDITAARNVTRDAGFALTVIATLQQDLASLQRRMPHNDRVVIVDVLRLLDALRTTEGR